MRISIEARPAQIESAVDWVSGFIGAAVDKRIAALEQQEAANPLLALHFCETFALEFALANARRYRKSTGRLPMGEEYFPLYSFLLPASRIYAALPPSSQKPYIGRLRDAVNGSFGARPFAYEVSIATHLMGQGWDVEFADYAGTARFDLLARRGAVEVEVECKTTSGDTGRKIHRQEANRLAQLLLPTTQALAEIRGCHRILIVVPDRLGPSNEELEGIAAAVATAVNRKDQADAPTVRVEYMFDGLDPWHEPGDDVMEAISFFEQRFGRTNANLMFHGRSGYSVVAVMIVSAKADSVVDAIAEEAKKAAGQCSGSRPALIALHLVDEVNRHDLESMLRSSNGMHQITHAVLRSEARRHVDTVAFTFPQARRTDGRGSAWLSGNLISLYNPEPLYPCAEIRSIFRPSGQM
ncbi:hypothetical protein [Bradyrhizobium pachyrhizi]|uniref:hypothetical protein n=1 Tax=Bradyrhizobium pachyrhizi TaxID=280333 RepID=UPI0012E3E906|nr:hypothetical protein [Bradyrhizobium pachyrhizi]